MYKLTFYIPKEDKEDLKTALFNAGAGQIGDYDSCCWEIEGFGQFRPLPGSDPFIGNNNELSRIPEYRIEMICAEEKIPEIMEAFFSAHPYETPAYDLIKVETWGEIK